MRFFRSGILFLPSPPPPYIHLHNSTGFYYSILPFDGDVGGGDGDGGIDDGPNGVVDCDEPFFRPYHHGTRSPSLLSLSPSPPIQVGIR